MLNREIRTGSAPVTVISLHGSRAIGHRGARHRGDCFNSNGGSAHRASQEYPVRRIAHVALLRAAAGPLGFDSDREGVALTDHVYQSLG